MMTSDDPWTSIDPPVVDGTINGRRVDAMLPWGFFWARGVDRRCLLVFQSRAASKLGARIPKLKGLEITISEPDQSGTSTLILSLLDSAQRDIFHRLCLDIVAAAGKARSEAEAADLFLARTWRWHHLLRGGLDKRLSTEEQKGLLGELIVIERLLLPHLSPRDAISAWTGPLGAPKDFEIGRLCIEAKARRGAATPFVAISSEYQLDTAGTDALYLHVVEIDSTPEGTKDAFTINAVAARLRDRIANDDPEAANQFERLLLSSGFRWEDDYTDSRWIKGANHLFEVRNDFPRITPANFSPGVTNVRYAVSLKECEAFRVADDVVMTRLKERRNGDSTG